MKEVVSFIIYYQMIDLSKIIIYWYKFMLKKIISIGCCLMVTACVNVDKTYGPNGEESFSITCSGTAQDWGACLSKAGEICGSRGYNIISANGDKGGMATANQNVLFGTTTINRNLLVSCK